MTNPTLPLGKILSGDCLKILRELPDSCADLVFADPPYFLQLNQELTRPDRSVVNGVDEDWDKFTDFEAYDSFTEDWLQSMQRVMKPDGSLWVIGSYHNIYRIGKILQDQGFWLINDIIWVKSNPMPNFRGTRFANAHETLLWAVKSKTAKYHFNYQSLKNMNDGLQMRSDWHMPLCTGKERLKDQNGAKVHPTQKPETLLYRVIAACSKPGDVVLDPFAGTGTTLAVAKKLGRKFIGIEQRADYIQAANERLKNLQITGEEERYLKMLSRKSHPRMPFGRLLEHGIIQAGETLFSAKRRHQAVVYADASIEAGGMRGSIHQVGATLQQTDSCNGWTFWHVDHNDTLVPLTKLRSELYDRTPPKAARAPYPMREPVQASMETLMPDPIRTLMREAGSISPSQVIALHEPDDREAMAMSQMVRSQLNLGNQATQQIFDMLR